MMACAVHRTVEDFRAACDEVREGGTLGLVPTMGALHAGHLSLIREARRHSSQVAVTIFVNPTQFGPSEDLDKYPRDLSGDVAKCEEAGASLVFAPNVTDMYPEGERTRVRVDGMTRALCGTSRPGHFEGVTTIVTKLFAVSGPCTAVFGRKDYQQFRVLERMTRDLLLPVKVIGAPTVRESDGLALSSRNVYLSAEQRERALCIPRGLVAARRAFADGERNVRVLERLVTDSIEAGGLSVDYVTLADADTIEPFADGADGSDGTDGAHGSMGDRAVLAVAAFAGPTRLIDNTVLGEDDGSGFGEALMKPHPYPGRFIVLEGIDGAGTTTHSKRLYKALRQRGTEVVHSFEPTNGPIGGLIRQVLQNRLGVSDHTGLRPFSWSTMALLFAADRLDHLDSVVVPALADGRIVVSDRYDLSSLLYQSVTAPAGDGVISWIRTLNERALRPDLTLVLDVSVDTAEKRRLQRSGRDEDVRRA